MVPTRAPMQGSLSTQVPSTFTWWTWTARETARRPISTALPPSQNRAGSIWREAAYGDQIAVGVDARDGYVAVNGWKEISREKGVDFCRRLRDAGVKTVIYTDISRDGAGQGTNLELYRELSGIEGLEITASGGVSSIEELRELERMGVRAAILGKALYSGRLNLRTVIEEVGVC